MSDKVVFKKDFFQLRENDVFGVALKDLFNVVDTLPRVPQPGKPSLVVEEVDVIPEGDLLGTLGGALVIKVPAAPGLLNLVFSWAGKKRAFPEWGIFTVSCLTDVFSALNEPNESLVVKEIVALLSQEDYETFGENEAPVLLNRLNRLYQDNVGKISESNSAGQVSGLMRVLLELTGLDALPENEPARSFFLSPAGSRLFSILTVLSNIKQSFDRYLDSKPEDRRGAVSVLLTNSQFGLSISDPNSEEEFQSFLDYLMMRGLFGKDIIGAISNLQDIDSAMSVSMFRVVKKVVTELEEVDIQAITKRIIEIENTMKDEKTA